VDEWVAFYNTQRPHQSLDMQTPADRFTAGGAAPVTVPAPDRTGDDWVSRRVASNGVVCVAWQQVSVGRHHAGARCDVHVTDRLLQFWIGNDLTKTVARAGRGEIRKKRASIHRATS
ncbi:integrase core domain-containing protein, partial [Trujillonella endophytica]